MCTSLISCGNTNSKIKSIVLSANELTLTVEEQISLTAIAIPENATETTSWKSADPNIATVDANGNVTAKSVGNTTIIISSKSGISAQCSISVKEKSAYDRLDKEEKEFADVFISNAIHYFKNPDSVVIRKISPKIEGSSTTGGDFWQIEVSSENGFGGTTVQQIFLSVNGTKVVNGGQGEFLLEDDSYDCNLITRAIQERIN